MAVYRIYLVHADGRLEPDASFYCTTDEEAVCKLHHPPRPDVLRADIRAELWQGGRFIAVAGQIRRRPDPGSHPAHA